MKKIMISIFLLFITIKVCSQNFMEINFNKEINHNDTCIRFYNVINLDIKDKNVWEYILEDLYNVILITPKNRVQGDNDNDPDYYSACDNIIFYCIDGYLDTALLSLEGLNNEILQKKVICTIDYQTGDLTKDPFYSGYYSKRKKQKSSVSDG